MGLDIQIKIVGNSGCVVELIQRDARVIVAKRATSAAYNHRLQLQINKQIHCRNANRLAFVRIPEVISLKETDGAVLALMEYLTFQDSLDFFSVASKDLIDSVASKVFAYIDKSVEKSVILEVPVQVIQSKVMAIRDQLTLQQKLPVFSAQIERGIHYLEQLEKLVLPIGDCHGDLTFSNIMIAADASQIGLFDFLDSFVDSPIIDIAKLRQDTRFFWTAQYESDPVREIRFIQVMKYFDRLLKIHFESIDWFQETIELFCFITLLRIAPYSHSNLQDRFLLQSLRSIRFKND